MEINQEIYNNSSLNVFQLLDQYNDNSNVINKSLIENNLKETPINFFTIVNGFTLYSYATLLSLNCLELIHDIYLNNKSKLKNFNKPYEIMNEDGSRPIHLSIEYNLKNQLNFLINKVEVDVNISDKNGNTPIHLTCLYNRPELLKMILYSKNINLNVYNNKLQVPLSICIEKNNLEMSSILLKRGAELIIRIGKRIINLYNQVKRIGDDKMNKLFKNHLRSEKNKSKLKKIKDYYSKKQKLYAKEYQFLCHSLDSNNNLDLIKNFAQRLKIVHDESKLEHDVNIKHELCKKISEKIALYNIKHRLT